MIDAIMTAHTMARGYEAHGVELPEQARRAFAGWDALVAVRDANVGLDARQLAEDYLTGTLDDLGPAAIELARLQTARDGMGPIALDAQYPLGLAAHRALTADADRVATELDGRYRDHAAEVVGALDYMSADDYRDRAAKVIARSEASAVAYHRARQACAALDGIRVFVMGLRRDVPGSHAPYLIALGPDADTTTLPTADDALQAGGWLGLFAIPGTEPRLGTLADAADVRQRAQELTAAAQRAGSRARTGKARQGWPKVIG